jgi:uroporphyrinogen-III synthase
MFKNKHIVITRPVQQAHNIQQALLEHRAEVVLFPVLEIEAIEVIDIPTIDLFDCLIFISPNAVKYAQRYLNTSQLRTKTIAAIGKKTADSLQHYGIQTDIVPANRFTTESFLQLPVIQTVEAKRILIFRGRGGRELLAETLRQRGAKVQYAEVYQRICPNGSAERLKQLWQQQRLDRIVITSSEGLYNLYKISQADWIKDVPLLLGSPRMQQAAQHLEHRGNIIVASNPSDEAILHRLKNWVQQESIG